MRIVFMGTPDYSVKTLEAILQAGHNVVGVFAQPDKPVGRKHILTPPPVKVFAESHSIPVFQPDTLRDGKALETLKQLSPEIIVVVAYGKILPKEILELPKYGCINGHASLLPKYRGASPIQWCIVCGETKTGVTTQIMGEGIDTGDILEMAETDIGDEETAEQLFERLSVISADLMVSTVEKLSKGEITPKPQNHEKATYAPILKKEMAQLDFNKSAKELHNAVRGYYSWPCAFFFMNGKRIKVIESRIGENCNGVPGAVVGNKDELVIACGDGVSLRLLTVQPEGSKPMNSGQMLKGHAVEIGTVVG
ncbi:MAG: methionyl-tRNA formyltransferase [Ruminococcaceae bacterium]|nr:methionyl-tRNA formyltransferase [Oscillospiraceae bacterium]